MAAIFPLAFLFSSVSAAPTEFGVADDITVHGTDGTVPDPDAEVKGFTVFGSTDILTHISTAPGSVVINGALQARELYVVGQSTFANVYTIGYSSASKYYGDGSSLTGLTGLADNLGDHTATQDLKMAGFNVVNAAAVTASSYTAVGAGFGGAQLALAGNVVISSETQASLGAGVRVSTNMYIVGFASATRFFGDGSGLTGLGGTLSGGQTPKVPYWTSGNALGNSSLSQDAGGLTVMGGTLTVQGAGGIAASRQLFAPNVEVSSETSVPLGAGVRVSTNVYIVGFSSAAKYYGDGSALTGLSGLSDNLGNHTATQDLKLAGFNIVGAASVTASSYTAAGTGFHGAQLALANNVAISSETQAALGAGVRVSTNMYVVGFSSATKYYGDGSALTGLTGLADNLGNHTATQDLKMEGFDIVNASSITVAAGKPGLTVSTNLIVMNGNVGIGSPAPAGALTIGAGQILVPNGSAAAPSYAFGTDKTTGLFLGGGSLPHISIWGNDSVTFTPSQLLVSFTGSAAQPAFAYSNRGLYFPGNDIAFARTGTELMRVTAAGTVGIGSASPWAALDVVSTGTADNTWAQIWRNSSGVEVASMTSTGKFYATLGNATGDNLGSHTAAQDLNMAGFAVVNAGAVTASSYTAVGAGFGGAQLALAGNVVISSEAQPALGAGVRVSTNVYIVGFSSAAKYYGDGSSLTGLSALADNLGNHTATQDLKLAGYNIAGAGSVTASSYTATGAGFGGAQLALAGNVVISSEAQASLGAGVRVSTNVYIVGFSSAAKYYGDGSGLFNLSASVGDSLGTHIATKTLDMSGFDIVNASSISVAANKPGLTISTNLFVMNGNLGVGTSSPLAKADVTGNELRLGPAGYPASYSTTNSGYLVIDKSGTAGDASLVLRDQGNARAEIGLVTDNDIHFKTVTGTYGSETFTDRLLIRGTGEVDATGLLRSYATSGVARVFAGNSDGATAGAALEMSYDFGSSLSRITSIERGNVYRDLVIEGNGLRFQTGAASLTEAMRITNDGAVGVGTANPLARLDVVSTGTTSNQYAQIWRKSDGTIVASMTATGVMFATMPPGTGDNLGTHVAGQDLNMSGFSIVNAVSVTASSYTAVGAGFGGAQLALAGNVIISSEAQPALGAGVRVSTNMYVVGFASATKFYGDGSGLTGLGGNDNLGNHTAAQQLNMNNWAVWSSSAITAALYQIKGTTVVALVSADGTSFAAGPDAGRVNTGGNNAFLGAAAGWYNNSGANNTAAGYAAGYHNSSGAGNVSVGYNSAYNNDFGSQNALVGAEAGYGTFGFSFDNATALGYQAGYKLTSGAGNTLLGHKAGYNITNGGGNIVIGADMDTSAPTVSNELNIGGVIYGNLAARTIGISTRAPQAALDIVSTGTGPNVYAQIWRDGTGVVVASMTSQGKLFADVSGAAGLPQAGGGDSLGTHIATQTLNMAGFQIKNISSVTVISPDTLASSLWVSTSMQTPALYVSTGGLVGIGTSSPAYKLQILGKLGVFQTGNDDQSGIVSTSQDGVSRAVRLWAGNDGTSRLESGLGGTGVLVLNTGGGKVGIGTATPYHRIDLGSGGGSIGLGQYSGLATGATSFIGLYGNSGSWDDNSGVGGIYFKKLDASGSNAIGFVTYNAAGGNTTRLYINEAGNLGVGTLAPLAKLDVVSTGTTSSQFAQVWRKSDGTVVASMTATGVLFATMPPGTGDNLGTHVAGQDLNMSGFNIINLSSISVAASTPGLTVSSNLYVVNGYAGIGTQSPSAPLHVAKEFPVATDSVVEKLDFGNLTNRKISFGLTSGALTYIQPSQSADETQYRDLALVPKGANVVVGSGSANYRLVVSSGAGESGTLMAVSTGGVSVIRMTGSGEIYANKYYGDGSGLTGMSGALSGGQAPKFPYWTSGNTLGNSALSQDAGGLTVMNSTLTVQGGAFSVGGSSLVVANNNVGIGAANPQAPLHVKGGALTDAYFTTVDFNTVSHTGSVLEITHAGRTGNTYSELRALSSGYDAWNNLVLQSGGGNVGISSTTPMYRLVVSSGAGESGTVMAVSTGSTNVFWVAGDGAHATRYYGDGSALTGIAGDNLGSHTAAQNLNMAAFNIVNVSSLNYMSNVYLASAAAANGGGLYVSSNVYVVGFSSAARYYGDGSALTGIAGDNLGSHTATKDLNLSGFNVANANFVTASSASFANGVTASSFTASSAAGIGAAQVKFAPAIWVSSAAPAQYGGVFVSTHLYTSANVYAGNITATKFYGDGSGLTNLSARNYLTVPIPAAVNDYAEIGNFDISNGGHNLFVAVTVSDAGFIVAKQYMLPLSYNMTSGLWRDAVPVSNTGAYSGGNDLALEVRVNNTTAYLRVRRTGGAAAGTALVSMEQVGSTSDNFTPTGGSGTSASNPYLAVTALTQTAGNVGIGTVSPGSKLDVAGDVTLSGSMRVLSLGAAQGIRDSGVQDLTLFTSAVSPGPVVLAPGGNESARFTPDLKLGIGTVSPAYRLQVSSAAGFAGTVMAVSTGTSDVIRMTGAGEIYANKYYGDGSSLTGLNSLADNLGNHTAAQNLNMAGFNIVNVSTVSALQDLLASRVVISSAAGFAGNMLVVSTGTSSGVIRLTGAGEVYATKFIGDGSGLTGMAGSLSGGQVPKLPYWTSGNTLGNSSLSQDAGGITVMGSTLTVQGNAFSVGGSTLSVVNGNVGIGVQSPTNKLEVQDVGGMAFQVNTQAGYVSLKVNGVEVARMKP